LAAIASLSSGSGFTSAASAQNYWDTFANSGFQPVIFHFLALLIGCAIIYRGVVGGIERTNRILIPILFGLLFVAAIRAVTLEGSARGLMFLFDPKWEDLKDATPREMGATSLLVFVLIFVGLWPAPLMNVINSGVSDLLSRF